MRIRYYGPFAVKTGYARACHDYLMALHTAGAELDIRPLLDCNTDDLSPRYEALLPFVNRELASPDVVVVHTVPMYSQEFVTTDLTPPEGAKKVCLTTWETTKLPKGCAEVLDQNFDLFVVPSKHNRDVFKQEISWTKIQVVPHAYDSAFWDKPTELPPINDVMPFTFLNIGVFSERKNPIGLLKAYLTEFTSADNVVLKMLTPGYNTADIQHLVRCMGLTNLPRVEFITAHLDDEEVRKLHANSHCYVTVTRGEGWGLGEFEAAIIGNTVVGTDWSGHTDFLRTHDTFLPVGYTLTPAIAADQILGKPIEIAGMTIRPVSSYVSSGVDASQDWAEPDLQMAKRQMRTAYHRRFNRIPLNRAKEKYGYEAVGKQFLAALESVK